jgi:hypothetical protein
MSQQNSSVISGFVKPDFEPVQEAFVENSTRRKELGADPAHRGRPDLAWDNVFSCRHIL